MIEYDEDAMDEFIQDAYELKVDELLNHLDAAGMECVNEGRLRGAYKDQTGNLRASVNYAVIFDGIIVRGGKSYPGDTQEGSAQALSFLQQIAKENNKGVVFALVAGMNYAVYVENGHYYKVNGETRYTQPRDVLASAETKADQVVAKVLKDLWA